MKFPRPPQENTVAEPAAYILDKMECIEYGKLEEGSEDGGPASKMDREGIPGANDWSEAHRYCWVPCALKEKMGSYDRRGATNCMQDYGPSRCAWINFGMAMIGLACCCACCFGTSLLFVYMRKRKMKDAYESGDIDTADVPPIDGENEK